MFDYLQKYQQVPASVRSRLDTPLVKATIQQLENTYHLSLAVLLIKIMVKDIPISRLSYYFSENNGLSGEQAKKLTAELQAKVLVVVQDYLAKPLNAPIDINRLAQGGQFNDSVNSNQPSITNKNNSQPLIDLETTLNKLVSQQTLFKQPGQINRWRQLAKTFLLGVRNQRAVDDFLLRSIDNGGLGLSTDQTQQLNEQLNRAKELLQQSARQQVVVKAPTKPTDQLIAQAVIRDFESDLLTNLKKIDNQPRQELKTETELPAPLTTTTKLLSAATLLEIIPPVTTEKIVNSIPDQISQSTPSQSPAKPSQPDQLKNNSTPTIVVPVDQRTADNKTGKIRMDDVRFTPKTLTPIDELANLNLKRFRYLGNNPEERAQKVKEKLDMLTEYGYSKRLQGISAWRQSPLNRLYLEIGQRTIQSCQSAEQMLSEQIAQDADSLTFKEFVAIMNLNKQIRF